VAQKLVDDLHFVLASNQHTQGKHWQKV
jgi:hypothetical protein